MRQNGGSKTTCIGKNRLQYLYQVSYQARQSIRLILGTAEIDEACVAVYGTKVSSKAAAAAGLAAASTK